MGVFTVRHIPQCHFCLSKKLLLLKASHILIFLDIFAAIPLCILIYYLQLSLCNMLLPQQSKSSNTLRSDLSFQALVVITQHLSACYAYTNTSLASSSRTGPPVINKCDIYVINDLKCRLILNEMKLRYIMHLPHTVKTQQC